MNWTYVAARVAVDAGDSDKNYLSTCAMASRSQPRDGVGLYGTDGML
jgi:hypothetical protein